MNKAVVVIFLLFASASYAQDEKAIVKQALGFEDNDAAFISMEILHSSRDAGDQYYLVTVVQYTNGGCRPRGTCGCGTTRKMISLQLNSASLLAKQEVILESCHLSQLQSMVSDHGNMTIIYVDDIKKSCADERQIGGIAIYKYNGDDPGKALQPIDTIEYESITKKSIPSYSGDDITDDKCFYEKHRFSGDQWGGSWTSSAVFEKSPLKDDVYGVGRFLGYLRAGKFVPAEQSDGISSAVKANARRLLDEQTKRERSRKPERSLRELRAQALSYYDAGNYEMAQVMYTIIVRKYGYQNSLSMVANDLALSLYKQGKYDASESWSLRVLEGQQSKLSSVANYAQYAAATYYNLGLVAEARNEMADALANYRESYELRNTAPAQEAIRRIEENVTRSP